MSEKRLSGDIDKKLDQYLNPALEKAEQKFGEFAANLMRQEQKTEKTMERVAQKNEQATKKFVQSIAKNNKDISSIIDKAFPDLGEKMAGKFDIFGSKKYKDQEKILDKNAENIKKSIQNYIDTIQEVYDTAEKFNAKQSGNDVDSSLWLRGFLPKP